MWRLKFYKAYAKDKRLKRLLAYWGKSKKGSIIGGKQCTGYGTVQS